MRRAIQIYFRGLQFLLKTLAGLLIIPVTLQIASRYTGWIPRYIWTEEAARFLFIWIVMIGASIAVREGTHFKVDVLPHPTSRWGTFLSHGADGDQHGGDPRGLPRRRCHLGPLRAGASAGRNAGGAGGRA